MKKFRTQSVLSDACPQEGHWTDEDPEPQKDKRKHLLMASSRLTLILTPRLELLMSPQVVTSCGAVIRETQPAARLGTFGDGFPGGGYLGCLFFPEFSENKTFRVHSLLSWKLSPQD